VDCLLLEMVNMKRRSAMGRDLDDEVVEGPTGVLSGDLEDEITPGARLESKPLVGGEHLRGKSCHVVSSPRRTPPAIYLTFASISNLLHNVKY